MYNLYLKHSTNLSEPNSFTITGNRVHYTVQRGSNTITGSFPFIRSNRDVSTPDGVANIARIDGHTFRAYGTGLDAPVIFTNVPSDLFETK